MENRIMIRLVLLTEGMFFLSLIMAFVYMAMHAGFEPHETAALNVTRTAGYSLCLLLSSFTLAIAERKSRQGKVAAVKIWIVVTITLGAVFLIGQGFEYKTLMSRNITIAGSVFGTSFYCLTGFHGLHVIVGLFMLALLLIFAFLGDFNKPTGPAFLKTVAVYWHFVDVVWLIVFLIVYLIPFFMPNIFHP